MYLMEDGNQSKMTQISVLEDELNMDAISGLAITTAFFRSDFDSDTSIDEVIDQDCWDSISEIAHSYYEWVGIKLSEPIDKYRIAQAIWGMDEDQVDEAFKEYFES